MLHNVEEEIDLRSPMLCERAGYFRVLSVFSAFSRDLTQD